MSLLKFKSFGLSRSAHNLAHPTAQHVFNIHEPTKLSSKNDRAIQLEVPGQATLSFNFLKSKAPKSGSKPGHIHLCTRKGTPILTVEIDNEKVNISGSEAYRFQKIKLAALSSMNLLHFEEPTKYLWVSVDKERGFVKVGHGYMLESNTLVRFEPKGKPGLEHVPGVLRNVEMMKLGDTWSLASPMKYWRLPVVRDPPHLVINGDQNTMSLLDSASVTLAAWLPIEAGRLYSAVQGSLIGLTQEQMNWINFSLRTEGCILYETLKIKERMSNVSLKKKTSYIRVGMGIPLGDSIGDMFVMEIWPIGHESAVHSHGDAVGVIKVLHGVIEVSLYNPLVDEKNSEAKPIKTLELKKGDITFLTPEFYQTHKLCNIRKDTSTVTLQCYSYLGVDTVHNEQFDYVSELDGCVHKFRPKRDFDFDELCQKTKQEYQERVKSVEPANQSGKHAKSAGAKLAVKPQLKLAKKVVDNFATQVALKWVLKHGASYEV